MSLLAAVEAISQGILLFFALFVGVILRAAFIAKSSLGGWAFTEQMLAGSTLEAPLLMAFLILQFGQFLLLPLQFLLNSLVLLAF